MNNASTARRILLVDLNNFAYYPTLSVGYLVASLRSGGYEVEVLSPLACGVQGVQHRRSQTLLGKLQESVFFSTHPLVEWSRDLLWSLWNRWQSRSRPGVVRSLRNSLRNGVDMVLMSAYPQHHATVVSVARMAKDHGLPVILGGPFFNLPSVTKEWLDIPGLTAIYGGEADHSLPYLVQSVFEGRDLADEPGVFLPDGRGGIPAPPLAPLSGLPVPDFSDFPWNLYPSRIVPVMTGRGCSWGACTFCGDVITANGRTFRSRPVEEVLEELEAQSRRYNTKDFILLDIMLNSNLRMWGALLDHFQERVPGARWMATVKVGEDGADGLSREELRAARAAGLTRMTFGLETGSQRVNDSMCKGTRIDRMSQCIRDGHAVGISMRVSVMQGYPGETAEDLEATIRFLSDHRSCLDEIRLARFKILPGTRFAKSYGRDSSQFPGMSQPKWKHRQALASYRYAPAREPRYRSGIARLLKIVQTINTRPLRPEARIFEGAM